MIIYGSTFSPYVRKAVVFAAEKGIDFEIQPSNGPAAPPEFKLASPFGKMPGLKDGDFAISDSTAIITYIDAIKPDPNLIPIEAKARARTIWYEEFGDTMVAACGGKIFFSRVVSPKFYGRPGDLALADQAQNTEFPELIAYLEGVMPASGYLVEDRFTLADIAVVSPLLTMSLADCLVDSGAYPKAAAYVAKIAERPTFAKLIAREKAQLSA